MTTLEYAADVNLLARAALGAQYELPEYFPELLESTTIGVYVLDLHIRDSRLRSLAAAQQAVQLAFDAAAFAVLHPYEAELGDPEVTALLLDTPDVVLNLVWAGNGSLKLSLVVNPQTEAGRSNIRLFFFLGLGLLDLMTTGGTVAGIAFAVGAGVEIVMRIGEWLQSRHPEPVHANSIDPQAIKDAYLKLGWKLPEQNWQPPGEDDNHEQVEQG